MTEEEKAACELWEKKMRSSEEDGGNLLRAAFEKEMQDAFSASNISQDGLLTKDEFKQFVIAMNENGLQHGLKNRDTTDEWVDKVYPGFNGYK